MIKKSILIIAIMQWIVFADPQVVAEFDAPTTNVTGLAIGKVSGEQVLWAVSYDSKKIYSLDPDNGTENSSFNYTTTFPSGPDYYFVGGLAFAGDTIFLPVWEDEQAPYFGIYTYRPDGTVIERVWNVIC